MQNSESRLQKAVEAIFVTVPGEEILLVRRKHWVVFLFPVFTLFTVSILSFFAALLILILAPDTIILVIPALYLIFSIVITLAIKAIIDWYFNIYIVTNKKITEVSYKPLTSRQVSEVLLNQVRCTEIDTKINGIINEFLDVGDIIITFDRPTHQEEFVLTNIKDPRSVETHLERNFSTNMREGVENPEIEQNWLLKKNGDNTKRWIYQERFNQRDLWGGG